ncbi:MAG: methionine synthase [Candidatus Omnitrophica bacterium]|nr:methionine synthase [Candidatus Omnitrophota bacterium]
MVTFFDQIKVFPPKERIYSRLGYAKGITRLNPEQKDKIDDYIKKAEELIDLKGAAARILIVKIDGSRVELGDDIVFESKSLGELLIGCEEAFFMGVTAGSGIVKAIRDNFSNDDATYAVILDAVVSETVDAGLAWIMNYFNRELYRQNKQFTERRFSAGYGDFLLEYQKLICRRLELERLGVSLTEAYMLVPEKSVTAVCGIKTIIRK